MKRLAMASFFLFSALAMAQPSAVSISRRALLNGKIQLTLRNEHRSAVTAYVIGYQQSRQSSFQAPDSLLALREPLIEPAAEIRLTLSDDPWELKAVLFADGTAQGHDRWIEAMRENRRNAWHEIAAALALLREKPTDLLDRFKAQNISPVTGLVCQQLKHGTPVPDIIRKLEMWAGELDKQRL